MPKVAKAPHAWGNPASCKCSVTKVYLSFSEVPPPLNISEEWELHIIIGFCQKAI